MTVPLDLADIQGNIHRAYGRFGFPHSRHLFFNIAAAAAGRRFVDGVRPLATTAEPWSDGVKPAMTLNIGFSFLGLHALDLPTRTLRMLPDEFIDGMGCRAGILGDVGASAPEQWDPIWHFGLNEPARQVHIWISVNVGAKPDGSPIEELAAITARLLGLADASGGVRLLAGHGKDGRGQWQDSKALMVAGPDGVMHPVPKEHFGFTDGIGDPVFRGQFSHAAEGLAADGGGKIAEGPFDAKHSWQPIETGEFILGQVDEGQELPVATKPANFARNGTFMVWRKLRQDVAAFVAEMQRQAAVWQAVTGCPDPVEAYETVCAKLVGRWRSGIPLIVAPTYAKHRQVLAEWQDALLLLARRPRTRAERARLDDCERMLTSFRYGDDVDGAKCPFGAHLRRANPRDMLDPALDASHGATTLTNRRRLLRRGLPYVDDDGDTGVVFMGICASLFRQFEFIQQQWMNYGLDMEAGNDSCPLIGSRSQSSKHVIPAGEANATTFIAADLPEFVTTRGGDYFFLPSLTALRMIAMGTVDTT